MIIRMCKLCENIIEYIEDIDDIDKDKIVYEDEKDIIVEGIYDKCYEKANIWQLL